MREKESPRDGLRGFSLDFAFPLVAAFTFQARTDERKEGDKSKRLQHDSRRFEMDLIFVFVVVIVLACRE